MCTFCRKRRLKNLHTLDILKMQLKSIYHLKEKLNTMLLNSNRCLSSSLLLPNLLSKTSLLEKTASLEEKPSLSNLTLKKLTNITYTSDLQILRPVNCIAVSAEHKKQLKTDRAGLIVWEFKESALMILQLWFLETR